MKRKPKDKKSSKGKELIHDPLWFLKARHCLKMVIVQAEKTLPSCGVCGLKDGRHRKFCPYALAKYLLGKLP